MKLSGEDERELTLIGEKLQKTRVDHVDPIHNCILTIIPSTHSSIGILMQK